MDEHDILTRYLRPLAAGFAPAGGLLDDAAVVQCSEALAISTDTLVEGVHFPSGTLSAEQVARRALRVNLSDLAASGAAPLCYVLSLQLPPTTDVNWMAAFAAGLRQDQEQFGLHLAGGDTVRTPGPLAVSLTVMGRVARGDALPRAGARTGDTLLVTGTIGDAHVGRLQMEGRLPADAGAEALAERFLLPTPRLEIGRNLAALAHAAIDVSDGLTADVRNLCVAAGKGARIWLAKVPLSEGARSVVKRGHVTLEELTTGGDDYELLFSVPQHAVREAIETAAESSVMMTAIGEVMDLEEVTILAPDGVAPRAARGGYVHAWAKPTG